MLKKRIEQGSDLTAYLSTDIARKKADKPDKLLNAWDIHHLHFSPARAGDVLFVKFTDSEAFVLQTLPHGRGHADTWVETSLLEILHNNWPEVAAGKIVGATATALTSKQRVARRNANTNFLTTMPDGVVYLGDGGLTVSGYCIFDVQKTDKVFDELDYWKNIFESNETSIREALGIRLPAEISIRLMLMAGQCCLYEPATRHRFKIEW